MRMIRPPGEPPQKSLGQDVRSPFACRTVTHKSERQKSHEHIVTMPEQAQTAFENESVYKKKRRQPVKRSASQGSRRRQSRPRGLHRVQRQLFPCDRSMLARLPPALWASHPGGVPQAPMLRCEYRIRTLTVQSEIREREERVHEWSSRRDG